MRGIRHRLLRLALVGAIVAPLVWALAIALSAESDPDRLRQDLAVSVLTALCVAGLVVFRVEGTRQVGLGTLIGLAAGLSTAWVAGSFRFSGVGLLLPITVGATAGLLEGVRPPSGSSRAATAGPIVIAGGVVGMGLIPAQTFAGPLAGAALGVVVAVVAVCRRDPGRGWRSGLRRPPVVLLLAATLVVVGSFLWIHAEYRAGYAQTGRSEALAFRNAVRFVALSTVLAPVVSFAMARGASDWLRPRLRVYDEILRYLRVMWIPLGGFVLGYLFIGLVFFALHAALHRSDPAAYVWDGAGDPSRGEWAIFTLNNAIAQDYNAIRPVSAGARLLVAAQVIVGVGWAVVVFAAVMASIQPELERVTRGGGSRDDTGD